MNVNSLILQAYRFAGMIEVDTDLQDYQFQLGLRYLNQVATLGSKNGVEVPYYQTLTFSTVSGTMNYYFGNPVADQIIPGFPYEILPDVPIVEEMDIVNMFWVPNTRVSLYRMTRQEWLNNLQSMNTSGQPVCYFFQKQQNASLITLWPIPNNSYTTQIQCKPRIGTFTADTEFVMDADYYLYFSMEVAKLVAFQFNQLWTSQKEDELQRIRSVLVNSPQFDLSVQVCPLNIGGAGAQLISTVPLI